MKLGAVVHGDGPHGTTLGLNQLLRPTIHERRRALLQFPDPQIARLPFDQREDARSGLTGPEHGDEELKRTAERDSVL